MQKNNNTNQQLDNEEALIISPIIDDPDVISLDELQQLEDNPSADVDGSTIPIDVSDAKTVFGHMPNPESDSDTLDTAHQLGIGLDDDEENPQELNLARDIDLAEKAHRDQ